MAKKYTHEEILRMPVAGKGGLRQACIELGIKLVEQDGETVNINSAKKPVLQETLLALAVEESAPTVEELESLAQHYWKQLKEYVISLWRAERIGDDPEYQREDGGFGRIALSFVRELENRPSNKSANGRIGVDAVKNLKAILKSKIRTLMNTDTDTRLQAHLPHVKFYFDKLFGYLDDTDGGHKYRQGIIDEILTPLTTQKKAKEAKQVEKRKSSIPEIRVTELYQWALDTLEDYSVKNFKDVVLALILVTGRRPGEIQATAKFTPTDKPNWVWFEGQLKTKGREDAEPVIEIPVLAPPHIIIEALDYLGEKKKRNLDSNLTNEERAKKANATWNSDVNQHAKNIDSRYLKREYKKELEEGQERAESKLTCNGCRDIYAQVVLKLFGDGSQDLYQLGKFLGHRLADSGTTERYDIDYKVLETEEELRALFNLAQT